MRGLAAGLALVVVLSGCSQAPAGQPTGPEVSPGQASLYGVVVDEAVRPVGGADVVLTGAVQRTGTTTDEGTFTFDGLPDGSYILGVSKAGFMPAQAAAIVAGGLSDVVRIQLATDPVTRPYHSAFAVDGFIECGTGLFDACNVANFLGGNVTNDRSRITLGLSGNASLIQTELIWQSTQAVSPRLAYGLDAFSAGCNPDNYWILNQTQGESPLLLKVNETLVREQGVGGPCPLNILVTASGPVCTPGSEGPPASVASLCPGLAIEQRFTLYLHAFYHYLPPADWRFSSDPVVPQPDSLLVPGA